MSFNARKHAGDVKQLHGQWVHLANATPASSPETFASLSLTVGSDVVIREMAALLF